MFGLSSKVASALVNQLPEEQAEQVEQMQEMFENPAESETLRTRARILARHEKRLREKALTAADAVDASHDVPQPLPEDERVEQLAALLGGLAQRDVRDAWLEHWGPAIDADAVDPTPYMGLAEDEWESTRQQWAERYREKADGEEVDHLTDEQLADAHVRSRFGVSLAEFEREIVDWDQSEAVTTAMSGPLNRTEDALDAIIEAADGGASA